MSKSAYTVQTQNRFAELDDSDSGQEDVPQRPSVPKPTEKPAVTAAKPPRDDAARKPRPARPTRPAENATVRPPDTGRVETLEDDNLGGDRVRRGRGGAFTRGRDSRRGAGRPLDRRSGTGRGSEMKKSGGGGHNWGNEEADFGGGTAEVTRTESEQIEGQQAAAEGGTSPTGSSGESAAVPVEKQPKMIGFAEYEKSCKEKRQLLAQNEPATGPVRCVDSTELEKEGFQKYEREETPEERAARELRVEEDEVEEPSQRTKTYHISEFTSGLSGRGGSRRGGRGGRAEAQVRRTADPVSLDLSDASAFPTLG